MRVLGYVRVSTQQQVEGGSFASQERAILSACEIRSWELVEIVAEAHSAKTLERPELTKVLERLKSGEADCLVTAYLDRLSRSAADFAHLMDRARAQGWQVVVLDIGVDTTTPVGECVAGIMSHIAQMQRRMIAQRTKEGLAVLREQGTKLGRPSSIDPELVARIHKMAQAKKSNPSKIAAALNAEGVPTARGGAMWRANTVKKVLQRPAT